MRKKKRNNLIFCTVILVYYFQFTQLQHFSKLSVSSQTNFRQLSELHWFTVIEELHFGQVKPAHFEQTTFVSSV